MFKCYLFFLWLFKNQYCRQPHMANALRLLYSFCIFKKRKCWRQESGRAWTSCSVSSRKPAHARIPSPFCCRRCVVLNAKRNTATAATDCYPKVDDVVYRHMLYGKRKKNLLSAVTNKLNLSGGASGQQCFEAFHVPKGGYKNRPCSKHRLHVYISL